MRGSEIQQALELKHRETFRDNYLIPAINAELIEMTQPDSPNSPKQRYRLTENGKAVKLALRDGIAQK